MEIKLNENVTVINFPTVECYFKEKNLGFRGIYDFYQNLTKIKRFYLQNVTVVNFSRVECYFVEKILRIDTTRLLPKLVFTI